MGNDGNGSASGHVRVYQNVAGSWNQIGSDINGEAIGDGSGFSVSLSSDGTIVAIGAHNNDGNGSASGHVRVYENLSGTWTQIGSDIDGEAASDLSGYSVSLSADGSIQWLLEQMKMMEMVLILVMLGCIKMWEAPGLK
jgi:Flp pilus assembly pilin Flp